MSEGLVVVPFRDREAPEGALQHGRQPLVALQSLEEGARVPAALSRAIVRVLEPPRLDEPDKGLHRDLLVPPCFGGDRRVREALLRRLVAAGVYLGMAQRQERLRLQRPIAEAHRL